MKRLLILFLLLLTSCAPLTQTETTALPATEAPAQAPTDIPAAAVDSATTTDTNVDILANLPSVSCDTGLTPADQEGPYYKADTPETIDLFTDGMQGKKLILAGTVVNADCFPIPNVFLDFWQADADGNYDNESYTLRGHQYTDNKGRYYLETVYPGIYPSRPIRHIHVMVQSLDGQTLVTQLYFPDQPVDGLTVQLEDQGDYYLGTFNFVVK